MTIPRLPPRYVPRPRLHTELDDGWDTPLTLLAAGPGSGKTVLLADWVRRTGSPAAWLTPVAADTRPDRFWRLLTSALRTSLATAWEGSIPTSDSAFDLVHDLFSGVPEAATRLTIVIDDAHLLKDPDVLDGLDAIVRGSLPGLRLVLAARSDPLLPLHRYRLAGQMRELRAADLALTPAEIRDLLAAHGVELPVREFDVLAARTEGWTAGVRLSAMRMQGSAAPGEFVAELAVDQGSIGEYLIDEVLRRLPEGHRRLLTQTSFLAEVSGPLAGAITGLDGCDQALTQLARDNSFVIPLDAAHQWYRYHPLLAEILRYLLQREPGPGVSVLKQRAARWFERTGDLGRAMSWAVQAGDQAYAMTLLARGGFTDALVHRRDLSGLGLDGLRPLPGGDDPDAARPAELTLARSIVAAAGGDAGAGARELDRVQALATAGQYTDPDLQTTADVVQLVLGQQAYDLLAVEDATGRLLSRAATAPGLLIPGLRAVVLLARASARFWHGEPADVGALLDEALAEAEQAGPPVIEVEVLAMSAFFHDYWSRRNRADQAAQRAHALLRQHTDLETPPLLELAKAMRCLLAADFKGRDEAIRRARTSSVAGLDPAVPVLLALGHVGVLLTSGADSEARGILQQIDGPLPPLLALQRDLLLAGLDMSLGRPRAALRLLRVYGNGPFGVIVAVPCARALLALNDVDGALTGIRKVLATPSNQAGRRTLIDALLCEAQIIQDRGEPGAALERLLRALDVARDEITLPFVLSTGTFAGLLARHPDAAARWPAPVAGLPAPRAPGDRIAPGDLAGPAAGLPEPLTEREYAVLRFLATSMSNSEIADELCLSVNTVKTHLAAIYRKLPARQRREAVLRARELELI